MIFFILIPWVKKYKIIFLYWFVFLYREVFQLWTSCIFHLSGVAYRVLEDFINCYYFNLWLYLILRIIIRLVSCWTLLCKQCFLCILHSVHCGLIINFKSSDEVTLWCYNSVVHELISILEGKPLHISLTVLDLYL